MPQNRPPTPIASLLKNAPEGQNLGTIPVSIFEKPIEPQANQTHWLRNQSKTLWRTAMAGEVLTKTERDTSKTVFSKDQPDELENFKAL